MIGLTLLLLFFGFLVFVALCPEEAIGVLLVLVWGGMAACAVIAPLVAAFG